MWRFVLSLCLLSLAALASAEPLKFKPQGGAVKTIVCPDKQGTCPDTATCCKLLSGKYGCCPLPQAVCCSDRLHCCPNGYTCDVPGQKCNRGDYSVAMVTKIPAETSDTVATVTMCPGEQGLGCLDNGTCCQGNSVDKWTCCMMPEGVCCKGGSFCCPRDSTCSNNGCVSTKNGRSFAWLRTSAASATSPSTTSAGATKTAPKQRVVSPSIATRPATSSKRLVCPGGKTFCESGRTCCYQDNGRFGCCSYVNGTCCADRKHCCPMGFNCNTKLEKCTKGDTLSLPFGETHVSQVNTPEPEEKVAVSDVICPDGASVCDDGSTCCLMLSGEYGCCPLPNAVCCSDHLHCCPQATVCDVSAGTCQRSDGSSVPWAEKKVPSNRAPLSDNSPPVASNSVPPSDNSLSNSALPSVASIACADNKTSCDDGTTCCQMLDGFYGCCPFSNAICCPDKLHCCPKTQKCDIKRGECISADGVTSSPWAQKMPARPLPRSPREEHVVSLTEVKVVGDVICPDSNAMCPDGNTCCRLPSGSWGCCRLPKAVCCSDKLHCCPHGTTCNLATSTCMGSNGEIVQWEAKTPARTIVQDTLCPDKQSYCPGDSTCCKQQSGQYGCCPLPQATCCSDGYHCCPNGYQCDVQKSSCVKATSEVSIPWSEKVPARQVPVADSNDANTLGWVVCPDKKSQCQDGDTCCKLASGVYRCCPFSPAVCCSDRADLAYCCPFGMKCDRGFCQSTSNSFSISWSRVRRASIVSMVTTVQCPDKTECPQGSTCCQMKSGKYGCCPYTNATCCSDGNSCCPNGYQCDVQKSSCVKATSEVSIPWSEKLPARQVPVADGNTLGWVVCPDKKSQCQDGYTCCKLASGVYGCCPFPSAVCCSDLAHCCPSGMKCNQGFCQSTSNSLSISWSRVRRASIVSMVTTVQCPDKTECPQGSTCCQMKSGKYGCCPYTNGTCCADQVHCCPTGFKCDPSGTRCDKAGNSQLSISSTMFTRNKPSSAAGTEQENIVCPDKSTCNEGSTCCKESGGVYGCCPFDSAVCCSDGVHCCPQGFACDPQSGTCTQAGGIPWMSKVPATPRRPLDDPTQKVVCDKDSSCEAGQTCCRRSTGEWACCPMEKAQCCSDGVHCCPHGDRCIEQAGMCVQGDGEMRDSATAAFLSMVRSAKSGSNSSTP